MISRLLLSLALAAAPVPTPVPHHADGHPCRQPRAVVTWRCEAGADLPRTRPGSLHAAMARAARLWAQCGVTTREARPGELADVTARVRWIDGPWWVMAHVLDWPCRGPVTIEFDPDETWDRPMLERVALHEFGHALGLQHDNGDSAMFPTFPRSAAVPTPRDRAEIARRYGARP